MSDEEKGEEIVQYKPTTDSEQLSSIQELADAQKRIVDLEMDLKQAQGLLQRTFMVLTSIRRMDQEILEEVARYLESK